MGLKNREDGKTNYVKIKNGKFYLATDKELTKSFEALDGIITDVYLKDEEYQGIPSRKLYVVVSSEGDRYVIGFNIESSYASTFISFAMSTDLTKPLLLVPKEDTVNKDGKEFKKRTIFISQNGKFAKSYFTKENPNGLPAMQKVERRGGKIEWIKDDVLDFYEDLVLNKIKPIVNGNKDSVGSVVKATDTPKQLNEVPVELPWEKDGDDADSSDLPF